VPGHSVLDRYADLLGQAISRSAHRPAPDWVDMIAAYRASFAAPIVMVQEAHSWKDHYRRGAWHVPRADVRVRERTFGARGMVRYAM
jgi:hypothetical protein